MKIIIELDEKQSQQVAKLLRDELSIMTDDTLSQLANLFSLVGGFSEKGRMKVKADLSEGLGAVQEKTRFYIQSLEEGKDIVLKDFQVENVAKIL